MEVRGAWEHNSCHTAGDNSQSLADNAYVVEDDLHEVAVGKAYGVEVGAPCNVVDSSIEAVVNVPCDFRNRNLLKKVVDSHGEVEADTVKTAGQFAFVL